MKKNIRALGIMNGTSIDAVDYALIEVNTQTLKPRFLGHKQKNLPTPLKKRILKAAKDEASTSEISSLHADLGRMYQKQTQSLKNQFRWDVVGVHGQTVHHEGARATLQIGSPAFIKAAFPKKPVVSDFRAMDIAWGGQGAPLAPFFLKALVENTRKPMAFQNLGGIANLCVFQGPKAWAFDSGPANILMDAWIRYKSKGRKQFDKNGDTAAAGLFELKSLKGLQSHPYFKKKAPKSCGREEFHLDMITKYAGRSFAKLSLKDQLATLVELSATSIAQAYRQFLPKCPEKIYCYGGGTYNTFLMNRLRYHLPESQWLFTDELKWPRQSVEAALIAYLAATRWLEKKVHIPTVTGAKSATLLGQLL